MDLYTRQRHMVDLLDNRVRKWCSDLRKRRPISRMTVRLYAANGPNNCVTLLPIPPC